MDEEAHETSRKRINKWWLLLAAVIVLIVAHTIWTTMERRALSARIDEIRKMGQPVLPEDFATTMPLDAANNAGTDIDAAEEALNTESQAWKQFDALEEFSLPLTPKERSVIDAAVQDQRAALDRLDSAATKSGLDYPVDLTTPVAGTLMLPNLKKVRALCNLEMAAALRDHERGDDASTLRRIDRIRQVSEYQDHLPSLVGHLVSVGISEMCWIRLIELAPDLTIGEAPTAVSPARVRSLIADLLNDSPRDESCVRTFYAERMVQQDLVKCFDGGIPISFDPTQPASTLNPKFIALARPILFQDARNMLNYMTAVAPLPREANWPGANRKSPPMPDRPPFHVFASMFLTPMDRVVQVHFRERTDRHLAAVALAARWYRVEHGGAYPKQLSDLVPAYLPSIPLDPFSAEGQPLRFKPDSKSPIAYSVGVDGNDDGGDETTTKGSAVPDEWKTRDRVAHLVRPPRPKTDDEQQP